MSGRSSCSVLLGEQAIGSGDDPKRVRGMPRRFSHSLYPLPCALEMRCCVVLTQDTLLPGATTLGLEGQATLSACHVTSATLTARYQVAGTDVSARCWYTSVVGEHTSSSLQTPTRCSACPVRSVSSRAQPSLATQAVSFPYWSSAHPSPVSRTPEAFNGLDSASAVTRHVAAAGRAGRSGVRGRCVCAELRCTRVSRPWYRHRPPLLPWY